MTGVHDEVERKAPVAAVPALEARLAAAAHASLGWTGPTRRVDGDRVREEHSTVIGDAAVGALIPERAGFVVTRAVDRDVREYTVATAHGDAMVRLERYPRMDVLVEVEGTPAAIEQGIAATGIARAEFTTASLAEMQSAFERRTGSRVRTTHADPG